MACFSIVSVSVSLSRLSQYIIIVKGEIHVFQWGEEVFNVALLEFPDQKHTHLIQFILRHPQPFTSLISMKKKPAACQGHICNANHETQAVIVGDGVFASAHQG